MDIPLGVDNVPPVDPAINLLVVVLHEIAHGLGFASTVDLETGERTVGVDDIFSRNLEDDTLGRPWPDLTDEERVASAINTGGLQWFGGIARFCANRVLDEGTAADDDVLMFAPAEVQLGSSVSHFDTSLMRDELMEPFITPSPSIDMTVAAFADMGWPISKKAAQEFCRPRMHMASD